VDERDEIHKLICIICTDYVPNFLGFCLFVLLLFCFFHWKNCQAVCHFDLNILLGYFLLIIIAVIFWVGLSPRFKQVDLISKLVIICKWGIFYNIYIILISIWKKTKLRYWSFVAFFDTDIQAHKQKHLGTHCKASYVGMAERTYTVKKIADWKNHRSKFDL